jgi:hypothetical protein
MFNIMSINENQLVDLWTTYTGFLHRLDDQNLNQMLEVLSDRLIMATQTLKKDDPYCGPGGLLRYAIDSFRTANKILKALESDVWDASRKTIAVITLLAPLGRIGDLENEQFIEQKSDWHRDKLGQLYDWNPACAKVSTPHRTLFLLQYFGVKISQEEHIGILCSNGMHLEENRFYLHEIPLNVRLCLMAFDFAYENEKYKTKQGSQNI